MQITYDTIIEQAVGDKANDMCALARLGVVLPIDKIPMCIYWSVVLTS